MVMCSSTAMSARDCTAASTAATTSMTGVAGTAAPPISADSSRSLTMWMRSFASPRSSATTEDDGSPAGRVRCRICRRASRTASGVRSSWLASATNARWRRSTSPSGCTARRVTSQLNTPARMINATPNTAAAHSKLTALTCRLSVSGTGSNSSPGDISERMYTKTATMTTATTAAHATAIRVPTRREARRMARVSLSTMRSLRVMVVPAGSPHRAR